MGNCGDHIVKDHSDININSNNMNNIITINNDNKNDYPSSCFGIKGNENSTNNGNVANRNIDISGLTDSRIKNVTKQFGNVDEFRRYDVSNHEIIKRKIGGVRDTDSGKNKGKENENVVVTTTEERRKKNEIFEKIERKEKIDNEMEIITSVQKLQKARDERENFQEIEDESNEKKSVKAKVNNELDEINSENSQLSRKLKNKTQKDFKIKKRIGIRKKECDKEKTRFYGVNSAIYLVSVIIEIAGIETEIELAMKIVLNPFGFPTPLVKRDYEDKEKITESRLPYHPNFVRILHSFVEKPDIKKLDHFDFDAEIVNNKSAFLIMKKYESNLQKLIDEKKYSFSEIELLEKLKPLLDVLCHIGRHKISHRDLKPDNILLDKNGNLSISDFGVFLDCNGEQGFNRSVANDSYFLRGGSPFYMPPDVNYGTDVINFKKYDIYSVGMIAYFMVSTSKTNTPFKDNSKKQEDYIEVPNSNISDQVKLLIKKMLKEDPLKRISCEEAYLETDELIENYKINRKKKEKGVEY